MELNAFDETYRNYHLLFSNCSRYKICKFDNHISYWLTYSKSELILRQFCPISSSFIILLYIILSNSLPAVYKHIGLYELGWPSGLSFLFKRFVILVSIWLFYNLQGKTSCRHQLSPFVHAPPAVPTMHASIVFIMPSGPGAFLFSLILLMHFSRMIEGISSSLPTAGTLLSNILCLIGNKELTISFTTSFIVSYNPDRLLLSFFITILQGLSHGSFSNDSNNFFHVLNLDFLISVRILFFFNLNSSYKFIISSSLFLFFCSS